MTITDKFISITDIRKNASFYINNISTTGERFIFVNNKPKAVLLDVEVYEDMMRRGEIEFAPLVGSSEVLGTEKHESLLSLMRSA